MTSCIPQLSFSFYRHRAIRADFFGGQITSDAGLLPLRAFDQRHGLTRDLAECLCDDRHESRTVLCGGRSAMVVPTATLEPKPNYLVWTL